jgi:hypothetical protein
MHHMTHACAAGATVTVMAAVTGTGSGRGAGTGAGSAHGSVMRQQQQVAATREEGPANAACHLLQAPEALRSMKGAAGDLWVAACLHVVCLPLPWKVPRVPTAGSWSRSL